MESNVAVGPTDESGGARNPVTDVRMMAMRAMMVKMEMKDIWETGESLPDEADNVKHKM